MTQQRQKVVTEELEGREKEEMRESERLDVKLKERISGGKEENKVGKEFIWLIHSWITMETKRCLCALQYGMPHMPLMWQLHRNYLIDMKYA